jgi:hypothetical protein
MIVHISPYDFDTGLINESERLSNVISATIERDATDETSLLESAVVKLDSTSFTKGWYAVDALVDGTRNRLGVFYFTLSNIEQETDGSMVYELQGVSVLYNASVSNVKGGYSVVQGNSGTATLESLLACCNTELDIEAFQIAKTQTFNGNVTNLGAVWSILRNAGMCMQITNEGTIKVMTIPTEATKQITKDGGGLTGTVAVSDNEVGYECELQGRPYDAVDIQLPNFGIQKTLLIASQSIDLENSLIAEETAKETVYDGE